MRANLVTLTLIACVGLLAACGGDGDSASGSSEPGAKVFADAGCGGCHTLDAAGSSGSVGPNLDDANPSSDEVAAKVKRGGGGMPSFEGDLSEQEIRDVAAFVSGGQAGQAAAGVSAIKPFKPNTERLEGCLDADCRRQAFGNIAFREGPKAALALFAEKLSDDAVQADCHRIAHTIGAASLQHHHGDVGKALAEGNAICASGYYHGLLEWKLADVPKDKVASVARTVCDQTKSTSSSFVYYQCVHGLGHGLMLYTLYDLPGALRLCHRAGHRLRPRLVQWRSLHGEPAVLLRHHLAVAEERRPALPVRNRLAVRQDLLLPPGDLADPPARRVGLEEDGGLVPQE